MIKLVYNSENFIDTASMEEAYYSSLYPKTFEKKPIKTKLGITVPFAFSLKELFEFFKYMDKDFNNVFDDFTLETILLVKPDELPDLIAIIESRLIDIDDVGDIEKKIKFLFNYSDKFQGECITSFFIDNFSFRTCHYCNRTYTTDLKIVDKEPVATYQLDHFFEKAHYPYLALSLYNFIPCCSTCNTTVKNREVNKKKDDCYAKNCIAPNRDNFDFHSKVNFIAKPENGILEPRRLEDFTLLLEDNSDDGEYKEYIELFRLDERYESHKDVVLEMLMKRDEYQDCKIEEISEMIKRPEEKIKQDLFGVEVYDNNLLNKPLSKLTQDIAKKLGLI